MGIHFQSVKNRLNIVRDIGFDGRPGLGDIGIDAQHEVELVGHQTETSDGDGEVGALVP